MYYQIFVDEKATPVRKIMTKFEKDLNNPLRSIMDDLEQISERIGEVEKLDSYIEEKMRDVGKNFIKF